MSWIILEYRVEITDIGFVDSRGTNIKVFFSGHKSKRTNPKQTNNIRSLTSQYEILTEPMKANTVIGWNLYQLFLGFCVVFLLCPRGFLQSTTQLHQSTSRSLERATSHIKVTCPTCLFRLPPWENVDRSTTLIYPTWVTSSLIIHKRNYAISSMLLPTLRVNFEVS